MNFDELMSGTPNPIIPFGKHRGNYASDIDVSYLDWLIGQNWLDSDLEKQIHEHLKTRPEWQSL